MCSTNFHKIQWKVAHGLWKKPLDFGDNLYHITQRLKSLFISNNFAT